MAAPTDIDSTGSSEVAKDEVRQQLNNVISALRIITAKLDLDAGVTDVNYFALSMDAAVATAPRKVRV